MPWGWEPPLDPDKPNCPYVSGFKAKIRTHIPPRPFRGPEYPFPDRPLMTDEYMASVTQSQHVLSHPFRDTAPPSMPQNADLNVIKALEIGNARGAQLVLCTVRRGSQNQSFRAVAKIFDPLYYSFSDSLVSSNPVDVVFNAEADYSKEAAAYKLLDEARLCGDFAPKYFGSWTFTLPLRVSNEVHQRSVRLVLIEYIEGISMFNLFAQNQGPHQTRDAFHLSLDYRLEVMAKVLDGVVKQSYVGLSQNDLAPRNVMLCPAPQKHAGHLQAPSRVVLIDYNHALVYKASKHWSGWTQTRELPTNPMQAFWRQHLEFGGWTPWEWGTHTNRYQEWLEDRFGGTSRSRYEPISKELENYLADRR